MGPKRFGKDYTTYLPYGCQPKNMGFYPPNHPILIGFGTIINHPKWYISGIFPANWVIIYYRSHPLRLNLNNPLIHWRLEDRAPGLGYVAKNHGDRKSPK